MNFFVTILILKVEEKKQHFLDVLCFTISRKVKTQLKHRKKTWAVYGKGDVTVEYIKSGLPSFIQESSCRMVLQSQCYTTWERANILKIFKPGVENDLHQLGYVSHFDVWVPHKLNKRKTLLDCIFTQDSLLKCKKKYQFLKLWWTMKCGYCTIMWNGKDCRANEMNHHQPYWRLVFIQRRWCHVYGRIGRKSFLRALCGKPDS